MFVFVSWMAATAVGSVVYLLLCKNLIRHIVKMWAKFRKYELRNTWKFLIGINVLFRSPLLYLNGINGPTGLDVRESRIIVPTCFSIAIFAKKCHQYQLDSSMLSFWLRNTFTIISTMMICKSSQANSGWVPTQSTQTWPSWHVACVT